MQAISVTKTFAGKAEIHNKEEPETSSQSFDAGRISYKRRQPNLTVLSFHYGILGNMKEIMSALLVSLKIGLKSKRFLMRMCVR